MKKVALLKSWKEDCLLMEQYIKQKAFDGSPLQILEAGCGQGWPFDLQGIRFKLTGVDIDKDVLELRRRRANDLTELIACDLRLLDLGKARFDVVYCSYVLEHIEDAKFVLEKFSKCIKSKGILILRIPDRNSVWGFVTRFTPFWFHIFHKKYIRGVRNAGKTGLGPFPTFHDPVVSRSGVHEFCRQHDFTIKEEYGHGYYLDQLRFTKFLIYVFVRCMSIISLRKLAWEHNDLTYILEKRVSGE